MRSWWWRLVRLGFQLLYRQMAWSYDLVSWLASLGQWRAWQRAALPHVHGKRVLELAHGPGHLLHDLARAGYDVTGLDLSPQMGRLARRRLLGAGLAVPLVRGRGEQLPFARASFDTVVSTFPTPFILAEETLQALQRVLRPGGRVVIVPQAILSGRTLPARLINWLYLITGQRNDGAAGSSINAPPPAWLARVQANRFDLEIVPVSLPRSDVLVVIAHSRDGPEPSSHPHPEEELGKPPLIW
jgi:SAM-dependent methyltransferase